MKAIVHHRYGPPELLTLEDVPIPSPKKNEVLIRVRAASVNALDWRILQADPFIVRLMMGLFSPRSKRLGADVAGVVESIGEDVTDFAPGDEVIADVAENGLGAFAEFVCSRSDKMAKKPKNLTFAEAAAIPVAAITAFQGLKKAETSLQGKEVLINGASGGVGSWAVLLAKAMGAKVSAVCHGSKAKRLGLIKPDKIIDYTKENFTQGGPYDIIFDAAISKSLQEIEPALKPGGVYIAAGGSIQKLFKAILFGGRFGKKHKKRFTNISAKTNRSDLEEIVRLIEKQKLKPLIDKSFSPAETPEAIRYLQERRVTGKVVIEI